LDLQHQLDGKMEESIRRLKDEIRAQKAQGKATAAADKARAEEAQRQAAADIDFPGKDTCSICQRETEVTANSNQEQRDLSLS
jgi:hypothetical protein